MVDIKTNREFYNLIVVEDFIEFGKKSLITNDSILTLTDEDIRKKYIFFGEEELADVVTFPTLITCVEDDRCYIGKVKDIDVRKKTTTFFFDTHIFDLCETEYWTFQILNLSEKLKIGKVTDRNELQEVHWAIKRADLIGTLTDYEKELGE